MKYVSTEQFSAAPDQYLERAVRYNEVIGVSTSEGNAVIISEEEYDALMETVFIMRSEETKLDITGARAETLEEAIAEEDVDWT